MSRKDKKKDWKPKFIQALRHAPQVENAARIERKAIISFSLCHFDCQKRKAELKAFREEKWNVILFFHLHLC